MSQLEIDLDYSLESITKFKIGVFKGILELINLRQIQATLQLVVIPSRTLFQAELVLILPSIVIGTNITLGYLAEVTGYLTI